MHAVKGRNIFDFEANPRVQMQGVKDGRNVWELEGAMFNFKLLWAAVEGLGSTNTRRGVHVARG